MAEIPQPESSTVAAINAAITRKAWSGESVRLSGSMIADPCERKLWYTFRWAVPKEQFEPRMLRLFETGHVYEARVLSWLRDAGIGIDEGTRDERGKLTQIEWTGVGGHFVDRLDGEAIGVPEAPRTRHAVEVKALKAETFRKIAKHGLEKSKPEYWAQAQLHMHGRGLTRTLFVVVNKDDDDIMALRLEYVADVALDMLARAERIVQAHTPPPKLHEDPDAKMAFNCRSCPALAVCHQAGMPRRNCRTCMHSTPVMDGNGGWRCDRWNKPLTRDEQKAGCPSHRYLPSLVPGEQVDVREEDEGVVYAMADGLWVDMGQAA